MVMSATTLAMSFLKTACNWLKIEEPKFGASVARLPRRCGGKSGRMNRSCVWRKVLLLSSSLKLSDPSFGFERGGEHPSLNLGAAGF